MYGWDEKVLYAIVRYKLKTLTNATSWCQHFWSRSQSHTLNTFWRQILQTCGRFMLAGCVVCQFPSTTETLLV